MVNIKDVSKKAGVSVATVSRVINKKRVKQETVDLVIKVMDELNYKPNQLARNLSKQSTNTIALIIPAINNPFFPELASSIENAANQAGYRVYLCNTDDNRDKLENYIHSLKTHLVDGVIIDSHMLRDDDLMTLKSINIPVVTIDRSNFENDFSYVSVKNKLGGQMAVEHLIEVGCNKIGHLRGPDKEVTATQRYWGYRKVVKAYDWFDQSWIAPGEFTVKGGYQGMKELLIKHPEIDGVFAANDLSAVGALKAAYEWNKRVPDDLAIIGFDGINMVDYMVPTITTIKQPIFKMGNLAVEELLEKIANPKGGVNKYELDLMLVQNESTLR
ncbi:LacI family DNA-binding transcriptional regulator [Amphibacillus jilinensis]|uniref:LacI family DNA-binding transcriptional regulator n=1 Tax=Amphibacillus jilinensis TaxID=1216008 RepID=UPI0002D8DAED|nr:LacI family DNA-binding transcriptional regulator [Amphibacillus jilinensis]